MQIKNTKNIFYTTSIAILATLLLWTSVFAGYEWRTIWWGKFVDGTNSLNAIYTAGNVGVGTADPSANLHVVGVDATSANEYRGFVVAGASDITKGVNIGYDQANDTWVIAASDNWTGWKDLSLNPVSGNVGIGTTNPTQRLEVYGTNAQPATSGTTSTAIARIRWSSNHSLDIGTQTNSPYGSWIQSVAHNNLASNLPLILNPNGGNVGIGTVNPTAKLQVVDSRDITPDNNWNGHIKISWSGYAGYIALDASAMRLGHTSWSRSLRLQTNETDRLTVEAAGDVGIGITNPVVKLHVVGDVRISESIQDASWDVIRDDDGGWVRTYGSTGWYNGTYAGGWYMYDSTYVRVYNSKSAVAWAFVYSSDRRLKTNITTLDNSKDILKIEPKNFDWKEHTGRPNNINDIGVIAQDVEAYFPQFVSSDDEGIKTVDYPKLVVPLIGAVQEQQKEIDTLKAEIAEIKALLK